MASKPAWVIAGLAVLSACYLGAKKAIGDTKAKVDKAPIPTSSKEVFATLPSDAIVGPRGWINWRGKQVTALPLLDKSEDGLFARLRYDDAQAVAKRENARLPTEVELRGLADDALHDLDVDMITPCFLPTQSMRDKTPRKEGESDVSYERRVRVDASSREWAEIHDFCVAEKLAKLGDTKRPVINIGKQWLDGGYNFGWFDSKAKPAQPKSAAHIGVDRRNTHIDYSQTTYLIRD